MDEEDFKCDVPFRIVTVYERLKARTELAKCTITIEECPHDDDDKYFPDF